MENIYLNYFQHLLASDERKYKYLVYDVLKIDENNANVIKLLLNQCGEDEVEKCISSIGSKVLQSAFREMRNSNILIKSIVFQNEISMSYILNYLQYLSLAPMMPLQLSTLATNLIHQLPTTYTSNCNVYYTNYFVSNNNIDSFFNSDSDSYTVLPSILKSITRLKFNDVDYLIMLLPAIELGHTEIMFKSNYNFNQQPKRCCVIELTNVQNLNNVNIILTNLINGNIYPNYMGFELMPENKLSQLINNKWRIYTIEKNIKARHVIKCYKPIFYNANVKDKNLVVLKANEIINAMLLLNNCHDLYFHEIHEEQQQQNTHLFVLKFGNFYFGTNMNQNLYQDLVANYCLDDYKILSLDTDLLFNRNKIKKIESCNNLIYTFNLDEGMEKLTVLCVSKTKFLNLSIIEQKEIDFIYTLTSKEEYHKVFKANTINNIYTINENVFLYEIKIPFNKHILGYIFVSSQHLLNWCEFEIAIRQVTTQKNSNTSIQLPPLSFRLLLMLKKFENIDYQVKQVVL
jgi:hypothetical protein